jgi:hypothetical protein
LPDILRILHQGIKIPFINVLFFGIDVNEKVNAEKRAYNGNDYDQNDGLS